MRRASERLIGACLRAAIHLLRCQKACATGVEHYDGIIETASAGLPRGPTSIARPTRPAGAYARLVASTEICRKGDVARMAKLFITRAATLIA